MKHKKIIIIWAWLHAEVLKNTIEASSKEYLFSWYLDDSRTWNEILWDINSFTNFTNSHYFICWIWDNQFRDAIFHKIKNSWWKFINVIHSSSIIEAWVDLWEWIFLWAHSYVNIWSKIGSNTIINNWVIIEHHNSIWTSVHMAPWTTTWWSTTINDRSFIWIGTSVINNIYIWKDNIIWASSLVHKDIKEDNIKAFWVPFKIR